MSKIRNYLTQPAVKKIRFFIQEAGGNEVFLVGKVNADKIVEAVQIFARGNAFSAPALLQVASQGDVVIHNHPSGALIPSSADMNVASILGNDGIGFYIVDNSVSDLYAAVEPFSQKQRVFVDSNQLIDIIGEKGLVAKKLKNYEFRPQQVDMIRAVSEAINSDKISLIEAGTGTGKTLAYLLPAISYAIVNEQKVVVSTNTINLQEQLINKDLPFLKSVLKTKFKAVLVKGRGNYVCKRKVAEVLSDVDLFSDEGEREELTTLLQWAETTSDGSKTDLNIAPKSNIWEKIQSESDTSLKTRCPFYNECFFYQARRKAASANILVANHHLLFADLALRSAKGNSENAVLPTYDRIIFDEAHNMEEVATHYFGTRVTYLGTLRILRRLYRQKGKHEKGLLIYLSSRLEKFGRRLLHEDFLKAQNEIQTYGIEAVQNLSLLLAETMENIYSVVTAEIPANATYNEIKLRLTYETIESENWRQEVAVPVERLVQEIRRFTSRLSQLLKKLNSQRGKMVEAVVSLTIDLQAQLDRLDAIANSIVHVLLDDETGYVRWLEVKQGFRNTKIVRLMASPLNIAPVLRESVFNKFSNVNLTSATLTVEGSFQYMKTRLGLDEIHPSRLIELALSSPFNYKKQALVAVPNDISEPNHRDFLAEISDMILADLKISRGRAFVLFTSYGLLNKVFFNVKDSLEKQGYSVYKQGQENRHKLLNRFREDVSSILFATDSFWEGVDVQGESLELVIITKLPFRVPSEPVVEARVEAIEQGGGNAFIEYTVPQAVIKFKQGFGRLIRKKSDRGAVLILDKRVIQKSYGRTFLNSLPACHLTVGSKREVMDELRSFYAKG